MWGSYHSNHLNYKSSFNIFYKKKVFINISKKIKNRYIYKFCSQINIMPKKDLYDEKSMSEYGNWNVASDYSRLKIMKQLYLADEYEVIATFGFSDFMEELSVNISVDVLKIRGFKRLIKALIMVIDNSKFAIKGTHKEKIIELRGELKRYWNVVPKLYKYKKNEKNKTQELKLIEKEYNPALERIIDIKSEINEPLNRYDLIFTHKEEFDPAAAKKKIKDDLKLRG